MTLPKVLVTSTIDHLDYNPPDIQGICQLVPLESKDREEFIKDLHGKYSDISGIYCKFSGSPTGPFDAELASHLPESCKVIANNGAGYDLIQVDEMTKRGIQVSHTPGAVDEATADTNVFLIVGAIRNFGKGIQELYKGNWIHNTSEANDPHGKTLGILGMGGIGRAVRDKVKAFGITKVLYYNRSRLDPELENGAEYCSFDDLLARADILSLNLPLNQHTRHIINKDTLAKCKDGVVIVNTARGAVIDEAALVDALESGKVKSCGLDVFENEPKIHPGLLKQPNCLLLPHMGTHSIETRKLMEQTTLNNVVGFFKQGKVVNLVGEQKGKF